MKKIFLELDTDIIDEKSLQRLINSIEKSWLSVYPEKIEGIHEQITDNLLPYLNDKYLKTKSNILDVGCGNGETLLKFKNLGHNAIGITLNDKDIESCKQKNLEVIKMDQSFLQFNENSFDFIWARHVLEHSIMPYHTLLEIKRVCRAEGLIYIEVPGSGTMCNHEKNANHYSILGKNEWIENFNKVNLELLEVKNIEHELLFKKENIKYSDTYWAFLLKKPNENITLALSKGENFGWGVCSNYLNQELKKIKKDIEEWDYLQNKSEVKKIRGKVFHALTNRDFNSIANIWGDENYGYTFFENELTENSKENAKKYNLVLGGSTWNKQKMNENGINNAGVLIQGVDPIKFYPGNQRQDDGKFIIFSGGKFELRKGQDIVLKAIKILQEKYKDIYLVNSWYNMWPESMKLMLNSKFIKFEFTENNWKEFMTHIYKINGIDPERIITLDIVNHDQLREIYLNTDLGLFPNRCEGGTNLVLMEYMACGKPVIASYTSGHKDILTFENSIMLEKMKSFKILYEEKLWADWEEPEIDEIIANIEYAYKNRDMLKKTGENAGLHMEKYTWTRTALSLLNNIT